MTFVVTAMFGLGVVLVLSSVEGVPLSQTFTGILTGTFAVAPGPATANTTTPQVGH